MNTISLIAQFTEAKYSLAAPIQDAIEICRGELCAANYAVVQIGHSKLIGCKPGNVQQFVEVTLEQSPRACTQIVFYCHATQTEFAAPGTPSTPLYA
jgi:hypothetical protein